MPGWESYFGRNWFFAHDLWTTHVRLAHLFIPMLTAEYLWNYYAWQIHMPFGSFFILTMTKAATIWAPTQGINRIFRMQGLDPMRGSFPVRFIYYLGWCLTTIPALIPYLLFSNDANRIFEEFIHQPILDILSKVSFEQMSIAGGALGTVLLSQKIIQSIKEHEKQKPKLKPSNSHSASSCQKLFVEK